MPFEKKLIIITGFLLLLSFIFPTMNWILIFSKFIVKNDLIKTAQNIAANDFLFRLGIFNELLTSAVIAGLALSLYLLLKQVNKNLALLGLLLKVMLVILTAVIALVHYLAIGILKGQVFTSDHSDALIGYLLTSHISITSLAGIFLGLSMIIFTYLFYKSDYLPGFLAGFGVLSFLFVFLYDSLMMISPDSTEKLLIQIIFTAPVCIFIFTAGFWLIIKGLKPVKEKM